MEMVEEGRRARDSSGSVADEASCAIVEEFTGLTDEKIEGGESQEMFTYT